MARLLPTHLSPQQGEEGIDQHEENHRWQNTLEAALVEVAHRGALLHRHQQKGAHYHKEGHADAAQEAVVKGHPEAVALVGQHRYIACQA